MAIRKCDNAVIRTTHRQFTHFRITVLSHWLIIFLQHRYNIIHIQRVLRCIWFDVFPDDFPVLYDQIRASEEVAEHLGEIHFVMLIAEFTDDFTQLNSYRNLKRMSSPYPPILLLLPRH